MSDRDHARTDRPVAEAAIGPAPIWTILWVATACIAYYALSALFSALISEDGLAAFRTSLGEPDGQMLDILGSGGLLAMSEWNIWSLITTNYLHNDLSHLRGNIIGLLILAPALERHFGAWRTFAIFTLAGLAASVASPLWGEIRSYGASGGVFGLLGARFALAVRVRQTDEGWKIFLVSLIWAILFVPLGSTADDPISHVSHAAGFLGGMLAGSLFHLSGGASRLPQRLFALTLLCLAIGALNGAWRSWQANERPDAWASYVNAHEKAAYNLLISSDAPDAESRTDRGWAFVANGDFTKALDDFDAALKSGPQSRAWLGRGSANFGLRRYEQAISDYGEAIRLEPTPLAYRLRAEAYEKREWPEEAAADLDNAVKLDASAESLLARARFHGDAGNAELALADYDKAVRMHPQRVRPLEARGIYQTSQKNYDAAARDYSAAIALGANDSSIYNNRAWALVLGGRAQEALPDVTLALELNPDSIAALDTRAHVYEKLGERDKAIADYRAVLVRDPNLKESREGLERLGVEP